MGGGSSSCGGDGGEEGFKNRKGLGGISKEGEYTIGMREA